MTDFDFMTSKLALKQLFESTTRPSETELRRVMGMALLRSVHSDKELYDWLDERRPVQHRTRIALDQYVSSTEFLAPLMFYVYDEIITKPFPTARKTLLTESVKEVLDHTPFPESPLWVYGFTDTEIIDESFAYRMAGVIRLHEMHKSKS